MWVDDGEVAFGDIQIYSEARTKKKRPMRKIGFLSSWEGVMAKSEAKKKVKPLPGEKKPPTPKLTRKLVEKRLVKA